MPWPGTASAVLPDLPFYVADPSGQYMVANYDNRYLGPMLYRKALANSRNVPAVQVLKKVGLAKNHDFFKRIGLENSDRPASHYGLGMAVGGLYVTLKDLVRAYGILANNGRNFSLQWQPPAGRGSFEKPPLHPAKLLFRGNVEQVLPEDVCGQIALYLSDPLSRSS